MKSKIKNILLALTPYGIVERHREFRKKKNVEQLEREYPRFLQEFDKYRNGHDHVTLIKQCPFTHIISVQGFGYSGSGAVVDLLREYDCNKVVGYVDAEGSVANALDADNYELDLVRTAGGLLEIEKYLGCNNIFQIDALLHRFVALVENSDLYLEVPQVRPYFYEFFSQITRLYHEINIKGRYYNTHLDYRGNNAILFLKDLSLSQYRQISRYLLYSIFKVYKGNSNCINLVIDQLFTDFEFDMKRNLEYVPELKTIVVYRDPRDVFVFANQVHEEWIPRKSVEDFVQWYKILIKHFNSSEHSTYLSMSFEQIITKYEDSVTLIEKYLDLKPEQHNHPLSALNPESSIGNIGIWKKISLNQAEIFKELRIVKS